MANMLFANNANTTLASSLTSVATTMSVTSASAFPSPTGSQYFYCTLADAATQTTIEIVKVTAVSGTTFTIVRGQDGTSGTAFASGAVVSLRLVRASLNDFPKLDEANTFSQAQTFNTPIAVGSGGTGTATSFTTGSVVYAGASGVYNQDNSNFFYDATNKSLGIQTNSPNTYGKLGISVPATASAVTQLIGMQNSAGVDSASLRIAGFDYRPNVQTAIDFIQNSGTNFQSQIAFSTNTGAGVTEKMRIFASGGVSIGNTTDPGATNLSVTGAVNAASFRPTSSVGPTNGMFLPAANNLGFTNNSAEAARFDTNSNFLVGTTSATGSSTNLVAIVGGLLKTSSGSTSAANNTATTIFTAPSLNNGTYIVSCNVPAADPTNYSCVSIICVDVTVLRTTVLVAGALISISVSGQNIRATQLSGTTTNIVWTVTRVS
jgi:hypothetical protein